ncbi:hypothetical protein AC1031_021361 [Aphanomyces cochlioides]|nr:hypothetical protein AC1031_021361 [Aphanomyces cochlioides]
MVRPGFFCCVPGCSNKNAISSTYIKGHFDGQHKNLPWSSLVRRHFTKKVRDPSAQHPFPENGTTTTNDDNSNKDSDDDCLEETSFPSFPNRSQEKLVATLTFLRRQPKKKQVELVMSMLMAICDALPIGHLEAMGLEQENVDAAVAAELEDEESNGAPRANASE